jgi:hypothetical protein
MIPKLCLSALALAATVSPVLAQQAKPAARPTPALKTVWPDEGPLKWTPRPTEAAITPNDLRTRLYQISDDSMQGRRIGELGNYKTTAYIAAEFKRMGLKPAGDNGTYFQNLPYGTSAYDSTAVRLVIGSTPLLIRRDWMPTVPSAASGAAGRASFQAVPTVFAGPAGDTTVRLDPALFRGKIAVFLAPAGGGGGRGGAGGRGAGGGRGTGGMAAPACSAERGWPNQVGAYDALLAAAAAAARGPAAGGRAGGGRGGAGRDGRAVEAAVAGVLMVSNLLPGNAFNVARGMQPAGDGLPSATITPEAAQQIFGKTVDQLTVGDVGQPVSGSWTYQFTMSPTPARNVIAILPGSDPARAAEYVLVGAHNDHNGVNNFAVDHDSLRAWNTIMRPDGANASVNCRPNETQQHLIDSLIAYARSIRPPRRDSTMNGADDDGSGTVVLLEIAEQFAKEHPARSIIFISHQGEEAGMLGSGWFTEHPTVPLDSVVAAHNMDMVGRGRVTDVAMGGPNSVQTLGSRRLSYEFGNIIDSVNAISRTPMAIDKTWDVPANPLNRFCRSDQVNYVKKNVPVTYFSTGYSRDYHQATDEPQYIDYDHAARVGRFVHDVMTAIANRADRPAISGADPTMPTCR